MDAEQLKLRTRNFALRCMKLADSLPANKPSGRALANQLVRCGTSVGANYRAACRARSKSEFAAKMGIVEEEADEAIFWMDLVVAAEMKPAAQVQPLIQEADELLRITVASIRTAKRSIRNPQSAIRNP